MSRIAGVATALPGRAFPQAAITDMLAPLISTSPETERILRRLHAGSGVESRHLVMPLDTYAERRWFSESNERFVSEATALGADCLIRALAEAGIEPQEVDLVVFTSVTGMSAPSVDALVVPIAGLRDDVKRLPLFGLGCVAGASGIARVHDYLEGHPDDVAVLLSVELCSLTLQRGDASMDNLVASALFGDGAAAVVMVGDGRDEPGPRVVATRSRLYPGTRDVIGFKPTETGFTIVLTADVPRVVERHIAVDVETFLAGHGLDVGDIGPWIAHPGGPRVLDAVERGLHLAPDSLAASRRSMAAVGNLSSSSVLHVLADELRAGHRAGAPSVLFALGPGVSAEYVLLEWADVAAAPLAAAA